MPFMEILTPPGLPSLGGNGKASEISGVCSENISTHAVPSIDTALLPKPQDCLAHLELLEAFVQLKCKVSQVASGGALGVFEHVWRAYVKVAATKFASWVSAVNQNQTTDGEAAFPLPDLDTLMVWHAFMLNPVKYAQFEKLTRLPPEGLNCVSASLPSVLNSATFIPLPVVNINDTTEATDTSPTFTVTTAAGHPAVVDFDLEAAVHRQHSFALKMTRYAWHRSPDADRILRRAIARYGKFFSVLKTNNRTMAVPTLDIDLVWHTHQLCCASYRSFSRIASPSGFVNHDDTVEDSVLEISFQATADLYRAMFDEEYAICLCWACAAQPTTSGLGPERIFPGGATPDVVAIHFNTEARIEEERLRRGCTGLDVAPDLAMPRCRSCGGHSGLGCWSGEGFRERKCSSCGNDNCSCSYGGGGNCGGGGCGSGCGGCGG
ncbi:hypothetical protein QBC47DRAFT_329937 [Echria macrotheca]|uniref:Uncharacterized protein n=1 Tax=Echria macrotheca TaxID=438768 RepID=A0AAJ0B428_9PEZI|nr:hypothetical protein QBC47DRAFT_329937 [Echria macrotheca]